MATEKLIIELQAKTGNLESELKKIQSELDGINSSTKKTDSGFAKLTKTATSVGGAILSMGTAIVTAGSALSTMIVLTAKGEQELQALSRQAKLSTGDFEALAFATKQYGINAEQIADISKDLSDKLGEFASVGTGAFQDFADVTNMTTEQAQALAGEWQSLSSDQVIGKMVAELDKAGASGNEVTFVLESMGSDLSKLVPLFADNSKELELLTSRYKDVNDQLSITTEEAKQLQEAATSFDLLTETIGNGAKLISAQFAPALSEFFNGVIDVVPQATQVVVDFVNSFRSPEQIESLDSVNRLIEDQSNKISELTEKRNAYVGVQGYNQDADQNEIIVKSRLNREILEEKNRLEELEAQRESILEQQERLADAETGNGGDISATIGSPVEAGDGSGGNEIQAILDRFKTEEELLAEKYATEQELLAGNKEALLELEQEYLNNLAEIKDEARNAELEKDQEAFDIMDQLRKDAIAQDREESKANDKKNKDKAKSNSAYLGAATAVGNALFEDNKAVRSGLIVADTAAGIMRAYADLPYPAAIAASVGVAATGIAQLAAVNSASKGGGSVTTPTAEPVDANPESTIDVSSADVSGSNSVVTLSVTADDSATAEYIAGIMSTAQVSGRI